MDDWTKNPHLRAWLDHVNNELIPMMEASEFVISLAPSGDADIKFAVETGLAIMMNKPIILCIYPGATAPPKLLKMADAIVEMDDPLNDSTRKRLFDAMAKITNRK